MMREKTKREIQPHNAGGSSRHNSIPLPAAFIIFFGMLLIAVVSSGCTGATAANSAKTVAASGSTGPTLTSEPVSQTVTVGQTAIFSVVASGTVPITYQWTKSGTVIAGAVGASYT